MRKSIDTLAILVADKLGLNPASGHLFLFHNRKGDKFKALFYQENYFALIYSRLEKGKFIFPKNDEGHLEINRAHLDKFARVICWVHPNVAPDAPLIIANYAQALFCHVQSSAVADPSNPEVLNSWRERFNLKYPDIKYQTVILGFKNGLHGSRWLTDQEISDGINHFLQHQKPLMV